MRVDCLWAAGKAIGIAFDGTGNGIVYDEDTQRFFMAGELKGIILQHISTEYGDEVCILAYLWSDRICWSDGPAYITQSPIQAG